MVHHVGLEVDPVDVDACVAFWTLLGWRQIAIPDAIGDRGRWLQRGSQQVHLLVVESPTAPHAGHVALVDADIDATVERLSAAGHEVLERTPYWGARRIFTRSPGGHCVELMSAPPVAPPAGLNDLIDAAPGAPPEGPA